MAVSRARVPQTSRVRPGGFHPARTSQAAAPRGWRFDRALIGAAGPFYGGAEGRKTAAFCGEPLAQYETNPDFPRVCKIGHRRDRPDGFAFSLVCSGSAVEAISLYATDRVTTTIRTQVTQRPGMSSDIVTVLRRSGPCTESAGRTP
jgi:hypothetical protein